MIPVNLKICRQRALIRLAGKMVSDMSVLSEMIACPECKDRAISELMRAINHLNLNNLDPNSIKQLGTNINVLLAKDVIIHEQTLDYIIETRQNLRTAFVVSRQREDTIINHAQQPPKWAEYLLYFLPKDRRESAIGDLEELYGKIYKRHGKRYAQLWCAAEVARSFWPLIGSAIKRLVKWGVIGVLGRMLGQYISWEWIRRIIP